MLIRIPILFKCPLIYPHILNALSYTYISLNAHSNNHNVETNLIGEF